MFYKHHSSSRNGITIKVSGSGVVITICLFYKIGNGLFIEQVLLLALSC